MLFVKKFFLKTLLVIDVLAIIIYQVCAIFLVRYDTVSGVMSDGFGRTLVPAPALFRSAYLGIKEWAGIGWFAVDTICSFVLLAVAYLLFSKITDKK